MHNEHVLMRFETGLLTLGYEGATAQDLVGTLALHQVATLVDVRLNPISRKPGLSKTKLSDRLEQAGIRYLHLRELGNPKDNRAGFREGNMESSSRYSKMLDAAPARDALLTIASLLKNERVALLCFERDHRTCHRALIVNSLDKQVGVTASVHHIEPVMG